MTTEIPLDKLGDFLSNLKETIKLDDNDLKKFEVMAYAGGRETGLFEAKYDDEFYSTYGFIAMVKDPSNETLSCALALYKLVLWL